MSDASFLIVLNDLAVMIARFGCLGLSHHDAPVAVREALCLSPAAQERMHARTGALEGFALLSTCNRLEFYVEQGAGDDRSLRTVVEGLLPPNHGQYLAGAALYVYRHAGMDAADHLARVASGLDSMVLGEPQIQGQVQECLRQSESLGCASPLLSSVFHAALRTGARVRQETALARSPASVASVAVDLAAQRLGPLSERRIAIIGTGVMGRLVAKILCGAGATQLSLVNRTQSHAAALAESIGAQAHALDAMEAALKQVEVVFSTARGHGVLLDESHINGRQDPLLILDLAVPRNVDASVQRLPGVQLYDIDSLRDGVDASLGLRRAEVPKAEVIVESEMATLQGRLRVQTVEPVIRRLRRKAEAIRQEELSRTMGYMNGLSADDAAQLRYFSQALVNKILHEPTTRLRERAAAKDAGDEAALIEALFAL